MLSFYIVPYAPRSHSPAAAIRRCRTYVYTHDRDLSSDVVRPSVSPALRTRLTAIVLNPHPPRGGLGHCRRRVHRPTCCGSGHYRRMIPHPKRRGRDHWQVRVLLASQSLGATGRARWNPRNCSCLAEQVPRAHTLHVLLRCVQDFNEVGQ